MLLLDTNAVSELRQRKGNRNAGFSRWAGSLDIDQAFISVITLFEIEGGILLKQKNDAAQASTLKTWFEQEVIRRFSDRILPVDEAAIRIAARFRLIRTLPDRDAFIAATAIYRDMTVVTRNIKDFADTGARLLDPWSD